MRCDEHRSGVCIANHVELFWEILACSQLTQEELDIVIEAIAENDTDGWWGHHGFEIELADQPAFAHFIGCSLGQGGIEFEYCGAFKDAQSLKDWIESQPLGQLDWTP